MSDHEFDSSPYEPEVSSLLDEERAASEPPGAARSRVYGRLERTLGLAAGAGAIVAASAPSSSLPTAGSALSHAGWLKMLGGLALAVAGGLGARALLSHDRHPGAPSASVEIERPAIVAPAVPTAAVPAPAPSIPSTAPAPAVAAGATPHPASPSHRSTAHAPARGGGLAAERALLEEARVAVARGDGREALAAIDRHARRFPQGQLAEERDSLRVRALVAAGRSAEARARGEQFRRRHARSIFLPAVEATLRTLP